MRPKKNARARPVPPPPEVELSYSPAGRETLAVIAEEHGPRETLRVGFDEGPEVTVVAGPVGRETLALISDLARPMRAEQPTLNYGDRISNAPGATTPTENPSVKAAPLVILEMLNFAIEGLTPAELGSESERRAFAAAHLIERLPARDPARIARTELSNPTPGNALLLTVWCRL